MLREKRSATFDGQRKQHQNTNGLSNGIHEFLIGDPSNILCRYQILQILRHRTQSTQRNRNKSVKAHISSDDLFESCLKGCEGGRQGKELTRMGMGIYQQSWIKTAKHTYTYTPIY